jgi:carbon-monoxide dehydrogenase medium subunit
VKPPTFRYHRPASLDEAIHLLANLEGEARVLAGGQSLVPLLNFRLAAPDHLVDINGVPELERFEVTADGVVAGAAVRQRQVERSAEVCRFHPLLAEAVGHIAHPVIRNRGTVVGSIAHADPAAELPTILALFGGTVAISGRGGSRVVSASEFFCGLFETAVQPGELVTHVEFPSVGASAGTAFVEVARRHGDFALCGVGAVVDGSSARLAFSGLSSRPIVVTIGAAEAADVSNVVAEALSGMDVTSDIHASSDYRRHLAATLAAQAIQTAEERRTASGGTR